MLPPRAHLGFALLKLDGQLFDRSLGHGFDLAAFGGYMPFHAWALAEDLFPLLYTEIACIGIACLLLAVQQGV